MSVLPAFISVPHTWVTLSELRRGYAVPETGLEDGGRRELLHGC